MNATPVRNRPRPYKFRSGLNDIVSKQKRDNGGGKTQC